MVDQNKKNGYPTLNEFKSRKFLNIATALGIGVSASAISLDLQSEEKTVTEEMEVENDKEIKDKIILLAANLGNDEFKERENSSDLLIKMGQKFQSEKKSEYLNFLKAELEKCKKSNDPEVKERAKKILLAITPKPPPLRIRSHRTAGVMIRK